MTNLEKFISLGGSIEECLIGVFVCFGENKMRIPLDYFSSDDPDKIAVLDYYLDILPRIYKEKDVLHI